MALASAALAAGGKFTLVIGGKIVGEDSMGAGASRAVSAVAVADLARASGASLTFDPAAGVISIAHDGGAVADALAGFTGGSVSFVVDGKITRTAVKLGPDGTPFIGTHDLKKLAESLGYSADLDGPGGVLAATPKAGGGAVAASGSGAPPARDTVAVEPAATPAQSWGLNGTFMKSVQAGSTGAAAPSGGGGGVCGYMDQMKVLWNGTQPSQEEKDQFNRLATLFTNNQKKVEGGAKIDGHKQFAGDLQVMEKELNSLNAKVLKRYDGTKASSPPEAAKEWYSVSNDFLDKFEAAMKICLQLVNIYKMPYDKQPSKEDIQKIHKKLQALNTQIQGIGAEQVQITVDLRQSNGCAPP